jgi:PAS domain S-box-containing protein
VDSDDDFLVVANAATDPRVKDKPASLTGAVGFYAGAVIRTADGRRDGAVCVIDREPRELGDPEQIESLKLLARLAGEELDRQRVFRAQTKRAHMLNLAETMAGLGHWFIDYETGERFWSDEVYRIHGYEPGAISPEQAIRHYDPADWATIQGRINDARATGEGYDVRLRLQRADGQWRITRAQARCEVGPSGNVIGIVGVFQDITEEVESRERIERSEGLFRMMSDTATDVIARYRPDGEFLYLSPAVERVLGYPPEELIGKSCADIIHPEDVEKTYARFAAFLKDGGGPGAHIDYRAVHRDGSIVWMEASPRAVQDAEGRILELHDHVRDVSARKRAERELEELVGTLQLAESVAGLGHWRLDLASGAVTWSPEVYRIHGVDQNSFDPSYDDAVSFYHSEDRDQVRAWVADAIATGRSSEFKLRLIRADGEQRVVQSQCLPQLDADGRTTVLFGVFQDITDAEHARQTLAESEARFRLLAEYADDVITINNLAGEFQYVSPAAATVMGYAPEEVIGRSFSDFLHPDDVERVRETFVAYAAAPNNGRCRLTYRGRRKDGSEVWLEARPQVVRDADGRAVGFQDVIRDVSETKRLEEALVEARDNAEAGARAKSDFLANMSHELRTPLTAVVGFSSLLKASANLPEQERRYADRIATASETLLGVINDILDYSKLEAEAVDLDPQPFSALAMSEAAISIVEQQCQEKGLTLKLIASPEATELLMGDEQRLRQVLLNFLSNAVKFTASGEIRVRVNLDVEGDARRLRVGVQDSGIGIPQERIASLFERFTQADASTTRNFGGTGLGLAISQRLIELMGGRIGAESRVGQGSTFWFELPLPTAEQPCQNAERPRGGGVPLAGRVLMVDDAPANRELVTTILGNLGVTVDTACDGAEGVAKAQAVGYDLILMDVHMPVLDGLAATRALRALGGPVGRTPIVALTANVQPDQVRRCLDAGMDGHLAKPLQLTQVVSTLATWLPACEDAA